MKKFGLVVLGAHTTNHTRDEIEKFREKPILLIEPVPANVNAIKENLKDFTNVIIEPIAIANKTEKRNFYFVKSESIAKLGKHWATGIGSFDKNHLLNHKSKRFKIEEVDIETIQIDCLTFEDILKKHKISEIEKMIIDIEGSEYEILKDIDLQKITTLEGELDAVSPKLESAGILEREAAELLSVVEKTNHDWQDEWEAFNKRAEAPRQTAEVEQSKIQQLENSVGRALQQKQNLEEELCSLEDLADNVHLREWVDQSRQIEDSITTAQEESSKCSAEIEASRIEVSAVSYTHLTLPTNREV